jgi:tRNA(His) guanylyltransferase
MDLGTRMKRYEAVSQNILIKRMPVIIRIDGKAFHTFTKGLEPFDPDLSQAMHNTAATLVREIQNAKLAYTQSDEISILLMDDATFETDQWFNGNVQKIVSVSASIATAIFNAMYKSKDLALFDSRVFNLAREEVQNYFIWRQKDAIRNSLSTYARMFFSHKDLIGKNSRDMHEMLKSIGKNWARDLQPEQKNGLTVMREVIYTGTFQDNPSLIEEIVKEKA